MVRRRSSVGSGSYPLGACHADERSERTRVNCQHLAEVDAQVQRWGVQCGDELVRALMRDLGHNKDSRVK